MKAKCFSMLAVLATASAAFAGADVEIRVGGQPVTQVVANPGDSFIAEVWVNPSQSLLLRGAQVDLRGSSSGLVLGQDTDGNGVGNFAFDYNVLAAAGSYADFSNLMAGNPLVASTPSTIYMGMAQGDQISLPAVQFTRLGSVRVEVPQTGTVNYVLDVLNIGQSDLDAGASLSFGFGTPTSSDPFTIWSTVDGDISYAAGAGPVAIVPEPATLLILALGGIAALRRRKNQ